MVAMVARMPARPPVVRTLPARLATAHRQRAMPAVVASSSPRPKQAGPIITRRRRPGANRDDLVEVIGETSNARHRRQPITRSRPPSRSSTAAAVCRICARPSHRAQAVNRHLIVGSFPATETARSYGSRPHITSRHLGVFPNAGPYLRSAHLDRLTAHGPGRADSPSTMLERSW